MKSAALSFSLAGALALTLGACSKQDADIAPATPQSVSPAEPAAPALTLSSYDKVGAEGKGFTAGAMMSAQTIYVLFDPQCPHCGHLWRQSLPLHNKVKFVWIPVAFNPGKSLGQAVGLLSAANPVEAMTAHETSLLANNGGLLPPATLDPALEAAVKKNTDLLASLGQHSVPFILGKHRVTGELVSNSGALETEALANKFGLN